MSFTSPLTDNHGGAATNISFTLLLLSAFSVRWAAAQTAEAPDLPPAPPFKFNPSVGLVAALIAMAVFFLAAYSIFTVHVASRRESVRAAGAPARAAMGTRRGLDPEVVGSFPTLVYADVKGLKLGKGALECAVCLSEFEDEETLRLIPKCDHVFHPECIDEWLTFHTTCPVCRADLVPRPGESIHPIPVVAGIQPSQVQDADYEYGSRDVEQGWEEREPSEVDKTSDENPTHKSGSGRPRRFHRSYSTGHSLVQPGDSMERFTLRLPFEVRQKVMSRAGSMAAGSGSSRRGCRPGGGDGSSRGKYFRRPQMLDRAFRSERWVFNRMPSFFSRASPFPSPRVPGSDNEGGSEGQSGRREEVLGQSSVLPV